MHVQTRSQNQQFMQKLPSTSENMVEEADNRHATNEREQLIEKTLDRQWTEMFKPISVRFSCESL